MIFTLSVNTSTEPQRAMMKQNLVEQHIIKKSDPRWTIIDGASFEAKNLYNKSLYEMRQQFFATRQNILGMTKKFFKMSDQLHWSVLCNEAKLWAEFKALPAKVSQLIVKKAFDNLNAFIQANNSYHKSGEGFTGQPKLPRYKHKETGRFPLYYNAQAISRFELIPMWFQFLIQYDLLDESQRQTNLQELRRFKAYLIQFAENNQSDLKLKENMLDWPTKV